MSIEKEAQATPQLIQVEQVKPNTTAAKGFSIATVIALILGGSLNYVDISYNQPECFKTVVNAYPNATVTAVPADAYQYVVRIPGIDGDRDTIRLVHTNMFSAEIMVDYLVPPALNSKVSL